MCEGALCWWVGPYRQRLAFRSAHVVLLPLPSFFLSLSSTVCFCSAPLGAAGAAVAAALCCCTHFNTPQLMLLLLVVPVQTYSTVATAASITISAFNSGIAMAPTASYRLLPLSLDCVYPFSFSTLSQIGLSQSSSFF